MSNYFQISFSPIEPEQQDWVIAHLTEAGYDGFEQNENVLKAFISEEKIDRSYLKELAFKYHLDYNEQLIQNQNWNQVWESSFQPVVVDDFVSIRAFFHPPATKTKIDIEITPKMSFGTGHHATTFMMIEEMREIEFKEKEVLDFGTGTGILAILAEKLGAKNIVAIDNDEWSIDNATDNIARNKCKNIQLKQSGDADAGLLFDVILANINKNVILDNLTTITRQMRSSGVLLLSGILEQDRQEILKAAVKNMLVFAGGRERANWLCLRFLC